MPEIKVPSSFFRSELRVYSDWRRAFARELLQNAVDADPGSIEITTETVDGLARVTFRDHGVGMSREVLEDVYFALGQSTKSDSPTSIGGFGRARIITCFAQRTYQIRTGHLVVTGAGGEYEITTGNRYVKGAEFIVDLIDDDDSEILRAFHSVLRSSQLRVPVTVNGLRTTPSPLGRAARVLRDSNGSAWARVYVTPGFGVMNLRVHGLLMYHRWTNASSDVTVELFPGRAREVLTASRDSLCDEYGQILDAFVSDLTQNKRRALRERVVPLDMRVRSGGMRRTAATRSSSESPSVAQVAFSGTAVEPPAPVGGGEIVAALRAPVAAPEMRSSFHLPQVQVQEASRFSVDFDVYLYAEDSSGRTRRLSREWNPVSWTSRDSRRRATLLMWQAACLAGVRALLELQPELDSVAWTVGWVFDEDAVATHRNVDDGHVLALNPVTTEGHRRWHLSSKDSRRAMQATALHEVAHIVASDHDEKFASLLTRLYSHVDQVATDTAMRLAARG